MGFPDEEAKRDAEELSDLQKLMILNELGEIAKEKYDDFIVTGGSSKGYNLRVLIGSLQFIPNLETFDNDYELRGINEHWTLVAIYFEYGTGLYNQKRAGRYRAGYIKPIIKEYMSFIAKDGKFVRTKRVRGVHPILAMTKAIKYVEFNRKEIQDTMIERMQI